MRKGLLGMVAGMIIMGLVVGALAWFLLSPEEEEFELDEEEA
ncbi:MAG: hypothetical protein ACOCQG_04855 [Candidatus Nanoarchaeia archaeon]